MTDIPYWATLSKNVKFELAPIMHIISLTFLQKVEGQLSPGAWKKATM